MSEEELTRERAETQRLKRELREARRRIRDLERAHGSWPGLLRALLRRIVNIRADLCQVAKSREERKRLTREADLIRQAGLFEESWYLKQNPDVARAGLSPLLHYLKFGWQEGRDPSPEFSTCFYLDTYADVAQAEINPLVHYATVGRLEQRKTKAEPQPEKPPEKRHEEFVRQIVSEHFDADFYRRQNSDVIAAGWDPLEHFLQEGWRQGRDPEPGFSVQFYLATYRDIVQAGVNPYYHYLVSGKREGRLALPKPQPTVKSA